VLVIFLVELLLNSSVIKNYLMFFELICKSIACLFFFANFLFNLDFMMRYHQNYGKKIIEQLAVASVILLKIFCMLFNLTGEHTEITIWSCLNKSLASSVILFGIEFVDVLLYLMLLNIDRS